MKHERGCDVNGTVVKFPGHGMKLLDKGYVVWIEILLTGYEVTELSTKTGNVFMYLTT